MVVGARSLYVAQVTLDRTIQQFDKEELARKQDSIYQYNIKYSDSIQTTQRFKQLADLLNTYDSLSRNQLEIAQNHLNTTKENQAYQLIVDKPKLFVEDLYYQYTHFNDKKVSERILVTWHVKNEGRRDALNVQSRVSLLLGFTKEETQIGEHNLSGNLTPKGYHTFRYNPLIGMEDRKNAIIRFKLKYTDGNDNKIYIEEFFYTPLVIGSDVTLRSLNTEEIQRLLKILE